VRCSTSSSSSNIYQVLPGMQLAWWMVPRGMYSTSPASSTTSSTGSPISSCVKLGLLYLRRGPSRYCLPRYPAYLEPVIQHILSPRLLIEMASNDLASNIRQALSAGAGANAEAWAGAWAETGGGGRGRDRRGRGRGGTGRGRCCGRRTCHSSWRTGRRAHVAHPTWAASPLGSAARTPATASYPPAAG